ncbi:rRNA-processing protein las1 [Microbotryomycetes sp. JL221]|nr:rRNA-processing protein las1 [Microbotryomycetes sp. JL221]
MLPHIVPWTTFEEFKHVFGLLFHSDGDTDSQRQAVEQINIWMMRGNCPHAAESTAALMELVLRDTARIGSSNRPTQLEQRLGYSMAIIRFVNSLIDPMQTTYYARSMAMLASQLGLPLWFVELRHAATHEDLPTLIVLQDAAKQALDWLYSNYWLKAISDTSNVAVPLVPLDELRHLLSTYKGFAKTSVRDASQTSKVRADLQKCVRGVEAWVGQAESMGRGRETAIEGLVEALIEVGALVPTAKKKRANARQPTLSDELSNIWSPLLNRLDDTFDGFLEALVARMLEFINVSSDSVDSSTAGKSLVATYSAWVIDIVKQADDDALLQSTLHSCLVAATPLSFALVDQLTRHDDDLNAKLRKLVNARRNFDTGLTVTLDDEQIDSKLKEMQHRGRQFDESVRARQARDSTEKMDATLTNLGGWSYVENWRPCPIGMLPNGKMSDLDWQWWTTEDDDARDS